MYIRLESEDLHTDDRGLTDAEKDALWLELLQEMPSAVTKAQHELQQSARWLGMANMALDGNQNFLVQSLLCRLVDNFLAYISDLVHLIYTTNPRTLLHMKDDAVSVADLLEQGDIDDIISLIAERRTTSLGLKSFEKLNHELHKSLDFKLAEKTSANEIGRLVAARNVIVHSRGRVSRTAAAHYKPYGFAAGEVVMPTREEVFEASKVLNTCAASIDERAVAKFGLAVAEDWMPPDWAFDERDREAVEETE